jgi:hypothetical protein
VLILYPASYEEFSWWYVKQNGLGFTFNDDTANKFKVSAGK